MVEPSNGWPRAWSKRRSCLRKSPFPRLSLRLWVLACLGRGKRLPKGGRKKVFRTITHATTGLFATPFSASVCDAKNHKGDGRFFLLEIARRALYIASIEHTERLIGVRENARSVHTENVTNSDRQPCVGHGLAWLCARVQKGRSPRSET